MPRFFSATPTASPAPSAACSAATPSDGCCNSPPANASNANLHGRMCWHSTRTCSNSICPRRTRPSPRQNASESPQHRSCWRQRRPARSQASAMQWIDHAKIAAALAVVILHVAAGVLSWNAVGTESWWCGNLYNALVRWCVPVFVMVSGALLLDSDKQEPIEVFYKKRLARVLVPLLFWSLLFMSWTFAKGALRGEPPPLSGLLQSVLLGQPFYHLWYLYMIPGLYLLTPFLRKITATSSRRELTWLIAATFALSAINQ